MSNFEPKTEITEVQRAQLIVSIMGQKTVAARQQLRTLVMPVLRAHEDKLEEAMEASDLLVTDAAAKVTPSLAEKRVKIRGFTIAALRDLLHVDTLMDLLDERCRGTASCNAADRLVRALTAPDDGHGVRGNTKTGWVLGKHQAVADEANTLLKSAEDYLDEECVIRPKPGSLTLNDDGELVEQADEDGTSRRVNADPQPAAPAGPMAGMIDQIAAMDPKIRSMIDGMLATAGLPSTEDMRIDMMASVARQSEMRQKVEGFEKQLEKLRKMASNAARSMANVKVAASGDGTIPKGEIVTKDADEVFGLPAGTLDRQVPVFEWDGVHPHVPAVIEDYVLRPDALEVVLDALDENEPLWLHGHTGSGKTSMIEQVCARLGWPWLCISLDSHVTRADLLGRDTLKVKDGASLSEWIDGAVPQAMKDGYVLCLDELDAIDKDAAYALQRVLEQGDLRLLEDGGRMVSPSQTFRIVSANNTTGQGDEYGMYPATSPHSMAFMDRFTRFVRVPYMDEDQRRSIMSSAAPALGEDDLGLLGQYVAEHMEAFTSAQVMLPITPRGYKSLARAMSKAIGRGKSSNEALRWAVQYGQLNRALSADRQVLQGLLDRVAPAGA